MMSQSVSGGVLPPRWWTRTIAEIAALTPVQPLLWPELNDLGIELAIKRDDRLDSFLSGNKFYKLFGHINAYRESSHIQWLTFGGAFSNHLHAFAAASAQLEIPAVAVIRGERPAVLSATLKDAAELGVRLEFVSRASYRRQHQQEWLARLQNELGDFYCVPEGGSGPLGALGCAQWAQQSLAMSPWTPTAICLPAGTGCSAAGVLSAAGDVPVHAYLSLKGTEAEGRAFAADISTLALQIAKLQGNDRQLPALILECNYHCGGYARFPDYLRDFMLAFEAQSDIRLDPIYTAKMAWGILAQARSGAWPTGSRLLILHTGGLQGRRGFSGL